MLGRGKRFFTSVEIERIMRVLLITLRRVTIFHYYLLLLIIFIVDISRVMMYMSTHKKH